MRRSSPLVAVFLTVVIDLLGFGIVLPLLPLYGDDLGASKATIGLLFISFSGLQFFAAPIWGRLSDRIGRRPILLLGLAGSVVSYVLFGLASAQLSLTWMFISRIVAGVFGGTISTAYAYIADVTPIEERGRGMALIGVAFGIGFTLGPAIGGLGHWIDPVAPGFIAAAFSLIAFLYCLRNLPEPERHVAAGRRTWFDVASFRKALGVATVPLLLLLGFLTITCFALMESTLGLLGKQVHKLDYYEIGLLFTWLGFCSAIAQGMIVRRYMMRVGEVRFVLIGAVMLAAGMVAFSMAPSLGWLIGLSPLAVLGFAMITPSLNSLLSRRSGRDVQGGIMGVNQSLQSLARIIGPMVGLPLFGLSVPLPFQVGAGIMVVCFVLGVLLARRPVADRS
ncbi:MAG: MFS transporter [Planctomycetota bacterium]|nr:MFS transporter [Planctomycetota bacterium]